MATGTSSGLFMISGVRRMIFLLFDIHSFAQMNEYDSEKST